MPIPAASSSTADSIAKTVWLSPYPRKAPDGTVLVYTAWASTFLLAQLYTARDSPQPWNITPTEWLP